MRWVMGGLLAVMVAAGLVAARPQAAREESPGRRTTVVGSVYQVDPAFNKVIAEGVARIRSDIKEHRDKGELIAYVSTMISARGGGYEPINVEIAAHVKRQLEEFHGRGFWALDPAAYQMPAVNGKEPQGGEYLLMWTEALAGPDGLAKDFDMVYFVGPSDVLSFFGVDDEPVLDVLNAYIKEKAERNGDFKKEIADNPARRQAFLRFYGLRASVAYSKGAHDEWNLFVRINRKRGVGDHIAMYYDGRALSPAEMETEIAPGYELR